MYDIIKVGVFGQARMKDCNKEWVALVLAIKSTCGEERTVQRPPS